MQTTNMLKKAQARRRQGGFTLIELISVIIILGILAAVITPKYFDMTTKAQQAAWDGGLSEGSARLNMAYANYIMTVGSKPASVANLNTNATLGDPITQVNIGDYDLAYSAVTVAGVPSVQIDLWPKGKTGATYLKSKTVPWPN